MRPDPAVSTPTAGTTDAAAATGIDARVIARRAGFTLDVALRVPAGEVVALMGPSGAGKSTLLGVLAGLTAFDEGDVRLGGRLLDQGPARRMPPSRRGVVLLGQDARLFPHLNARDNIAFGLRVRGVTKSAAETAAAEWLERVGLEGLGARRPAGLSGGQQQRVALARALATEPSALLLDEPLTALDPETASEVRALLHRQLAATRTTAIVATHDAVDAVALSGTLVVLEDGRVTQHGPVRDVLEWPATRFVAAVAGLNRVIGQRDAAAWRAGGLVLPVPQAAASVSRGAGAAAAVFRPGDVRILDRAPRGPGEWEARIARMEQTPAGVRVRTAEPDIAVDVPAALAAAWEPGTSLSLAVDPAAVRFGPA